MGHNVYTERYDLKEILASLYTENCFFCFLFFSFAFYQRDALFERSLYILSLPTSLFLYSHAHKPLNLEFSPLSLKKKKKTKKKKQEFALIPGFRTKKKFIIHPFIFLTRLKAVWFSETSAHLCSLFLKQKQKLGLQFISRILFFFPAYIQILYIDVYFITRILSYNLFFRLSISISL